MTTAKYLRPLGFCFVCLLLEVSLFAYTEEVVFEQVTGNTRVVYRNTRTETPDGFRITIRSPGEYNECELARDLSVRTWKITRSADNVDLFFERTGDKIYAEGRLNGKNFAKTYKINDDPWYQFHELCLDRFAVSPLESITFWTIDRRDMRIVKFKAEKTGREPVVTAAGIWDAVKVKISLTGVARLLRWHSTAWLRERDGRYLRLEAPGISASDEESIVELVEEKG